MSRWYDLSETEIRVARILVEEVRRPHQQIADELGISYWYVRNVIDNIARKLGVHGKLEIVSALLEIERHVDLKEERVDTIVDDSDRLATTPGFHVENYEEVCRCHGEPLNASGMCRVRAAESQFMKRIEGGWSPERDPDSYDSRRKY